MVAALARSAARVGNGCAVRRPVSTVFFIGVGGYSTAERLSMINDQCQGKCQWGVSHGHGSSRFARERSQPVQRSNIY